MRFVRSTWLLFPAIVVMLLATSVNGQSEVASVTNPAKTAAAANVPVFKDYRGVTIGMEAN